LKAFGNIAQHSGRKMGLVRHWWFLGRYRLGLLPGFQPVDWRRVERLVFVCRGNICRSPYAEARARQAGLSASSFGLESGPPGPAEETIVRLAAAAGIDLSSHRSRSIADLDVGNRDLLLGMEPWHGWALRRLAAGPGAQVTLLGLWATPPRPHLEDPYGLSETYFATCMQIINDALEGIAGKIDASRCDR
jgi:protein-tyrosine phosphatase